MRSPWAATAALKPSYSAHAALVSSTEPKHIDCPCALWVRALGKRAPALDQVVDRAASETHSKEGFLDVGHELREELVRACRLDDEDVFCEVLLPRLGRGPGFNPGGCGCSGPRGSWLGVARCSSGGAAHCRGAEVTGAGPRVPPVIPERGRMGPV
jgi:hypothetical protein